MKIVIMGVSGSGKSTLAAALAQFLDFTFLDADDLQPLENIERLTKGHVMTEDMQLPWMNACAAEMGRFDTAVLACPALRFAHRSVLRERVPDLCLVFPRIAIDLAETRLRHRGDVKKPQVNLQTQFATLEEPLLEERAIIVPSRLPVSKAVHLVASVLHARARDT